MTRQLFLTLLLVAVLPLLPQELYAWCPTVAGWLLRLAARLVPAPHRARYQQEWLAGLEAWDATWRHCSTRSASWSARRGCGYGCDLSAAPRKVAVPTPLDGAAAA
jgi:hypothetical protein